MKQTAELVDGRLTWSQRFNYSFHVGLPEAKARLQILQVQLKEDGREVDWESTQWKQLVKWSQGFSAADLADVVDDAVRKSADESTDRVKWYRAAPARNGGDEDGRTK